jgi:hypothetical protein
MRDPTLSILSALNRVDGGFVIVWCSDFAARDWLVTEVESLAGPEIGCLRVVTAAEALDHREELVLLVPGDEEAAIKDLDALRDRFLEPARSRPVVVFLLRDGPGRRALAEAPGFASLVRGSDPDPDELAEVDPRKERREFKHETGRTPREWLSRWRAGKVPRDAANLALAYWALLLEGR